MITTLIITLLIVAFIYAAWRANERTMEFEAMRLQFEQKEIGEAHFRDAYNRANERAGLLEGTNARQRDKILELQAELEKRRPRAARMSAIAQMSDDAIAETLNGTESLPAMRAVCAKLTAKIVELSDRATDAPRETVIRGAEVLAGYSSEQRLHDAGGVAHLAEFLGGLQDQIRAKEEPTREAA